MKHQTRPALIALPGGRGRKQQQPKGEIPTIVEIVGNPEKPLFAVGDRVPGYGKVVKVEWSVGTSVEDSADRGRYYVKRHYWKVSIDCPPKTQSFHALIAAGIWGYREDRLPPPVK